MMALKPNFYGEARNAMEQALMARGCSRKRRGIYMYPISDDVVAFVGLNESKWRGDTRLEIIPVIGVTNLRLVRLVEELFGKSEHPLPSQINSPLGYLMPDPDHRVWAFTPEIDIHHVAEDLAENVMRHGIPWVRKHDRLEALFESMHPNMVAWPPALRFDIPCALLLLGRKHAATEYVSEKLAEMQAPPGSPVFEEYRQFADRVRERAKAL